MSLITINVVIFAARVFSNPLEQLMTMYGFIQNHLFYNDPDTANGIGFDQQRSFTIFLFWIFIGNFSKIIFFYVYSAGVFIFHGITALIYIGVYIKRSLGHN